MVVLVSTGDDFEVTAEKDGTSNVITLWDSSAEPSKCPGQTYTWDGYSDQNSARSIYRYVEAHAERLRGKYLGWIHELGLSRVKQKRLVDHLVIQDDLSYWWMTLFAEQIVRDPLSFYDRSY